MKDVDDIYAILAEDGSLVVAKVGGRETALVTTDPGVIDHMVSLAKMLPAEQKLRLVEFSYVRVVKEIEL